MAADDVQDQMMEWSHVFISYRKASDKNLARKIYENLHDKILENGSKMRVYFDEQSLEDGQSWEDGFIQGLSRSWVFVPIVSVESLQEMVRKAEDQEECDDVLMEWFVAIELHLRGRIKAVFPIMASHSDKDFWHEAEDADHVGKDLAGLPKMHKAASTLERAQQHLKDLNSNLLKSQQVEKEGTETEKLEHLLETVVGRPEPTIFGAVKTVLRFQGADMRAGHNSTVGSVEMIPFAERQYLLRPYNKITSNCLVSGPLVLVNLNSIPEQVRLFHLPLPAKWAGPVQDPCDAAQRRRSVGTYSGQ